MPRTSSISAMFLLRAGILPCHPSLRLNLYAACRGWPGRRGAAGSHFSMAPLPVGCGASETNSGCVVQLSVHSEPSGYRGAANQCAQYQENHNQQPSGGLHCTLPATQSMLNMLQHGLCCPCRHLGLYLNAALRGFMCQQQIICPVFMTHKVSALVHCVIQGWRA